MYVCIERCGFFFSVIFWGGGGERVAGCGGWGGVYRKNKCIIMFGKRVEEGKRGTAVPRKLQNFCCRSPAVAGSARRFNYGIKFRGGCGPEWYRERGWVLGVVDVAINYSAASKRAKFGITASSSSSSSSRKFPARDDVSVLLLYTIF